MIKARNLLRNAYYFLNGYDADRFSAPKFFIREKNDLLKLSNKDAPVRLIVPRRKCRWNAGFQMSPKVHPFVATMKSGDIAYLENFYENYKPENVWEMYFLPPKKDSSVMSLPWKSVKMKNDLRETDGLKENGGYQWFGPVTPEKVKVEYNRCMNCYNSIKAEGYYPQKYGGYPRGHFLVGEDDYCFHVEGGQHRLAALAALKWKRIEVMSMNGPFQLVYRKDVDSWPAVKGGYMSIEDALSIFDLHITAGTYADQKKLIAPEKS